jgi:hypothetical protein
VSYVTIKAGVITRLNTVSPLTGRWLGYEPTTIEPPQGYVLLDRYERQKISATVVERHYFLLARVCIRWQEFEQAELELDPLVDAIGEAIEADNSLGGAIPNGLAKVTGGQATFVSFGQVIYRALDTTIEVVLK